LFDAVNGARQFIRYGISVDKKVSVMNLRHAQAYLNGTIIEGTLAEPFSIDKLPALQAVAQQTAPVTNTTAAPAQPATVNTAGTAPATPPATPGATPTAAPAAAVAPVAPVTIMPETLKDLGPGHERLQIAPELFDNMNEAVIRHFTDAIVDVRTRQTIVAQYNHSGLAFMVAMNKEITSTDISKNAAASARAGEMRNHRQAGISDTTTQSLNDFFNKDADLNDTLDGTPKHEDDDSLYVAYEDVLEEHSPDNHARITVEMNRIRTTAMLDKTTITNLEALKHRQLTSYSPRSKPPHCAALSKAEVHSPCKTRAATRKRRTRPPAKPSPETAKRAAKAATASQTTQCTSPRSSGRPACARASIAEAHPSTAENTWTRTVHRARPQRPR
jgi:hypothetical protein